MSIVSSILIPDAHTQIDGRRYVRAEFTDHLGDVRTTYWLAPVGEDSNARLTAMEAQMESDLSDSEVQENITQVLENGSLAIVTTDHSTNAANLAALREAYRDATETQAVMIGDFLSSLTDVQLQNIFSMTQGQVDTLRTNKLTPAANTAADIRTSVGE